MLLLVLATNVRAQAPLPPVEEANYADLVVQCNWLFRGEVLGDQERKSLRSLIADRSRRLGEKALAIQETLDRACLIGVTINPESRVKAARGPASSELVIGKEKLVLVKVQNDAGLTHALSVSGPQIRKQGQNGRERWLEITVFYPEPGPRKLSGQKVEYLILKLLAQEPGKREATLKFDAGQGTQDLGFRAEVPVLFTVKAR
jgi:hypothetical protein